MNFKFFVEQIGKKKDCNTHKLRRLVAAARIHYWNVMDGKNTTTLTFWKTNWLLRRKKKSQTNQRTHTYLTFTMYNRLLVTIFVRLQNRERETSSQFIGLIKWLSIDLQMNLSFLFIKQFCKTQFLFEHSLASFVIKTKMNFHTRNNTLMTFSISRTMIQMSTPHTCCYILVPNVGVVVRQTLFTCTINIHRTHGVGIVHGHKVSNKLIGLFVNIAQWRVDIWWMLVSALLSQLWFQ